MPRDSAKHGTRPVGLPIVLTLAILSLVAGTWVLGLVPLRALPEVGIYLALIAIIAAAYAVVPLVRDEPGPLIALPGIMFSLVAAAFWTMLGILAAPWIGVVMVLTAVMLGLSVLMLTSSRLATMHSDPIDFVNPILLKATGDTQPSRDSPVPVEIPFNQSTFPAWVHLARFLRAKKLADSVVLGPREVTIRMSRVFGMPRLWALALRPFGQTTVQVVPMGVAFVSVDRHVYRLLERPGPYTQYCRNIVASLAKIAELVSEGRTDEAERATRM